jgi:hypothetical protein
MFRVSRGETHQLSALICTARFRPFPGTKEKQIRSFEVSRSLNLSLMPISVDDIIMVIKRITLQMPAGSIPHRAMIVMCYQMTTYKARSPSASYILSVIKSYIRRRG